MQIPLFDPRRTHASVAEALESIALEVLRSGKYILGPAVAGFESALSDRLGGRHVLGVSSGTDALVLALHALGVGPGDEVVTTPYSFIASAEVIVRLGATPVFVDVVDGTWLLDGDAAAAAVGPKTKAIVTVHLFGAPFDPTPLAAARSKGVALIEDTAQALGATVGDRPAGGVGEAGAFSFFPTKTLGGFGDGGAVAFESAEAAERALRLRRHGRGSVPYVSEEAGYNMRLDALQAALLSVKLPLLDAHTSERRRLASRYVAGFAASPQISAALRAPDPAGHPGHAYGLFVVEIDEAHRDGLRAHLRDAGVAAGVYYPVPLHRQPAMGAHQLPEGAMPVSERASRTTLALPLFAGLTDDEVDHVVDSIAAYFGGAGR